MERDDYYPFGSRWNSGPEVPWNRYRFNGKEWQTFSGLPYIDYGARLYDPQWRLSWNAIDLMSEKYYSVSPYAFCSGNPVNFAIKREQEPPQVSSAEREQSQNLAGGLKGDKPKLKNMKNIAKKHIFLTCALALLLGLGGCGVTVKYSLSGASIPPDAKTFSVAYFPNNATMVSPILSSTMTDALVDIFSRRTRLMQVDEGGDFAFEGEITNYTSTTASVSSDDYALLNRLTITVRVRFTNAINEADSFANKTFSAYADYDSTKLLTEVEGELIPQIVDKLATDIFMASASNW